MERLEIEEMKNDIAEDETNDEATNVKVVKFYLPKKKPFYAA